MLYNKWREGEQDSCQRSVLTAIAAGYGAFTQSKAVFPKEMGGDLKHINDSDGQVSQPLWPNDALSLHHQTNLQYQKTG